VQQDAEIQQDGYYLISALLLFIKISDTEIIYMVSVVKVTFGL
jgi:hypothetical protein